MKLKAKIYWSIGFILALSLIALAVIAHAKPVVPRPVRTSSPNLAHIRALQLQINKLQGDLKICHDEVEILKSQLEKCEKGDDKVSDEGAAETPSSPK